MKKILFLALIVALASCDNDGIRTVDNYPVVVTGVPSVFETGDTVVAYSVDNVYVFEANPITTTCATWHDDSQFRTYFKIILK